MTQEVEQVAGAPLEGEAPTSTFETQAPAAPAAGAAVSDSPAQSVGGGVPPLAPTDTHTERLAEAQARVAELEAKLGETKSLAEQLQEQAQAVSALQGELANQRKHALLGALSEVQPDLREMYATQLGDVDVTTDAGKAKVQAFLEAHPGGVQRTTAGERATIATTDQLAEMESNPFFNKANYLEAMSSIGGMR